MNDYEDHPDGAYARGSDPATAWEAAQSMTLDMLTVSRQAVYRVLSAVGPCTDEVLLPAYRSAVEAGHEPPQKDSGIRTRRHDLVAVGLVHDTGQRAVLPSGRRAIVWEAL